MMLIARRWRRARVADDSGLELGEETCVYAYILQQMGE